MKCQIIFYTRSANNYPRLTPQKCFENKDLPLDKKYLG